MVFIICFISLLIERFFDWSHLRNWSWYYAWEKYLANKMPKLSGYFFITLLILPMVILAYLIIWLIAPLFYGLLRLIFELILVLYCLGPRNLWADIFACIKAFIQADESYATEKLKHLFTNSTPFESLDVHRDLTARFFVAANQRVFALIFWYSILGLLGALIYRMIALTADPSAPEGRSKQAAVVVLQVLDWLPVRVLSFIFALGGHFVQVIKAIQSYLTAGLSSNSTLLIEAGFEALSMTESNSEEGTLEKNAVHLVDRALVIYLVIIAIGTIIG